MRSERTIEASRIVTFTQSGSSVNLVFMAHAARPASPYADPTLVVDYVNASSQQSTTTTAALPGNNSWTGQPWFDDPFRSAGEAGGNWNKFMINGSNVTFLGWWTWPYFHCSSKRWLITYSIPVTRGPSSSDRLDGLLTVDVSVSSMDINQCGVHPNNNNNNTIPAGTDGSDAQTVMHFGGTHKCHETSTASFFFFFIFFNQIFLIKLDVVPIPARIRMDTRRIHLHLPARLLLGFPQKHDL